LTVGLSVTILLLINNSRSHWPYWFWGERSRSG